MSLKADSFCATINLQGLGKQHVKSPDVDFCLLPAQAEPPVGVGNSDMAASTKPHQAKATAPTCNHPCCAMASTLPEFASCQLKLSLSGSKMPGAVGNSSQVQSRWVEPHGHKLCRLFVGPGNGSWPVLLAYIKIA